MTAKVLEWFMLQRVTDAATIHELIGNCMSCGKIICEQEGRGACFFCQSLPDEDPEAVELGRAVLCDVVEIGGVEGGMAGGAGQAGPAAGVPARPGPEDGGCW